MNTSIGVQESPDKLTNKHVAQTKRKDIAAGDGVFVVSEKEFHSLNLNETEIKMLKKYLDPSDVYRYGYKWGKKYLIYSDGSGKELIRKQKEYLNLKAHLDKYKDFITSSNRPYGLHRPREIRFFTEPKILFKGMFVENEFTYDDECCFVGFSFSTIIQKDKKYDLKYILAILNSKFGLNWFWINGKKRGAGVDIGVEKLRIFPIKKANELEQQPFIRLVNEVLLIKRTNPQADTSALEGEIDQLVYGLYGLTKEEISIVEGREVNKDSEEEDIANPKVQENIEIIHLPPKTR